MRVHHHDFRDMGQSFALGFDLRRVLLMATAASWTFAVVGLYFVLISWRIAGHSLDKALTPEQIDRAWTVLTSTRFTFDRLLLWVGIAGLWWLGFARLVTPVARSIALEVSRDERLDSRQLTVASHRLSPLATGSPAMSLLLAGLLFALVLLWAVVAKIPGGVGPVLAGITLPLALIVAAICAAVLLVTLASLPLMVPAAVIECRDLMDVISRAAAYVLQRPLRYLWGLLIKCAVVTGAALVGGAVLLLSWGLVYGSLVVVGESGLAESSLNLSMRRGLVFEEHRTGALLLTGMFYASTLVALGWLMVIAAASDVILYMVMRYEVDGVTFDEIMIPQEHIEQHGLSAEDTRKQAEAALEVARAQAAGVETAAKT